MNAFADSFLVIAYAIPWFVAGLFVFAGVSKLKPENQAFYKDAIDNYSVVPITISGALARIIGLAEILIAGLCLFPATMQLGLTAAAGLLAVYALVILKQLLQGKADMDCGCAGPGAQIKISTPLIVRNLALIVLCLWATSQIPSGTTATWMLTIPFAAMLGAFYLSSEQLIANGQKIQQLRKTHWH